MNANQIGGSLDDVAQDAAESIVDDSTPLSVVANSASFDFSSATSAPEAVGSFSNGVTTPGTLLPTANQNAQGDAEYDGGIGLDEGIVLSTGWLSDTEFPFDIAPAAGQGSGVAGPNNGDPLDDGNEGEISVVHSLGTDADFEAEVFPGSSSGGGDAAALEFTITVEEPGYLEVTTVFASDEHDDWDDDPPPQGFNDSFCVFVGISNLAQINIGGNLQAFNLFELTDCHTLFLENQIAPSPSALQGSDHTIDGGAPFYDHEFGGFTIPLTWSKRLGPGTYDIKIVVQDVEDRKVDSALFIPENGIRLNTDVIVPGDCNLDGVVDELDEDLVDTHWGQTVAPWTDGDCTGDGFVDMNDKSAVLTHWGDYEWRADFDRDGDVDGSDLLIHLVHFGTTQCALKQHGDADGDGDVDPDDTDIWEEEVGGGVE